MNPHIVTVRPGEAWDLAVLDDPNVPLVRPPVTLRPSVLGDFERLWTAWRNRREDDLREAAVALLRQLLADLDDGTDRDAGTGTGTAAAP